MDSITSESHTESYTEVRNNAECIVLHTHYTCTCISADCTIVGLYFRVCGALVEGMPPK